MKESRRRFNGRERIALYLAQNGQCALCGEDLMSGWHADHVNPWSRNGITDVINGQALCPTCNLKKGNKVMGIELREWQKQAKRQYYIDSKQDWLAKVTPGGGKTTFALSVASDSLHDGVVDRVVVVVPTDGLRTQWTHQAQRLNIHLAIVSNADGGFENRKDFNGQVVTYAQVASQPELYRHGCGRYRTLVIFDECHHAGDNQSWGQAMEIAFGLAEKRLSMTGTPWRAPRRGKIPFVTYDAEGKLTPNFNFSYRDAIRHSVCRPVQFHAFDGTVTYVSLDSCFCVPQKIELPLSVADEEDNTQVLRDILRAEGNWMSSILREAIRTLNEIRSGENGEGAVPDAKGLVVVHDRTEARTVAKLLQRMTHERPALIISDPEEDEPNPQEELDRFRKNKQLWAVAVDMVSEGVDIPPLYVGVYATRKKTPLRFQQIVGRFVRQRPGDECAAIVFIPAVPSLLELASDIESELSHTVEDDDVSTGEKRERITQEDDEQDETPQFLLRDTSEAEFSRTIFHSDHFSEAEIKKARVNCEEFGIPARYAIELAKILRANNTPAEVKNTVETPQSQATPEEMTRQEEQRMLRRMLDKELGRVAGKLSESSGIDIGSAKKNVNARVQGWFGKQRKNMSIDELKNALQRVSTLIEETKVEG